MRLVPRHYFAIDGGSGAHVLAALVGLHPYVKQVASPRHADLLIIVEPITQKLASGVVELAKALPRPAGVLIVGEAEAGYGFLPGTERVRVEELLPGAQRIAAASVEAVLDAVLHQKEWQELPAIDQPGIDEETIQLPTKQELEMATELVVLSLGPVQPWTAGPLRLLIVCDGEQVLSAQVEAGYAQRGVGHAMTQVDWQQALQLASHLDPLAPVASQLVYVCALEQLQGWQAPPQLVKLREAAVAVERAQNVLWWLVRFARLLADVSLVSRAYRLATQLSERSAKIWRQAPPGWILPQQTLPPSAIRGDARGIAGLRQLADKTSVLRRHSERNHFLALRTRGIGVLNAEHLKARSVSGPNLWGSERGTGDVQSRLLARLDTAITDLRAASEVLEAGHTAPAHAVRWEVPAGEAHVSITGPRGDIGLHLVSSGGEQPAQVEWRRPSATLLPLLPEMLAGEILADAEVIMASLDLAMAEADG
jgi:NADH-quinone oxidoreductase subunit D